MKIITCMGRGMNNWNGIGRTGEDEFQGFIGFGIISRMKCLKDSMKTSKNKKEIWIKTN